MVTAVAPAFLHGDLRPVPAGTCPDEPSLPAGSGAGRGSRAAPRDALRPRLRALLREPWDLVHCWEEPYILAGGQVAWWAPRTAPSSSRRPRTSPSGIRRRSRRSSGTASTGARGGWPAARRWPRSSVRRRLRPEAAPGDAAGRGPRPLPPRPRRRREVRRDLGWEADGPPVVGYLGRFVAEKGLGTADRGARRRSPSPWRALFVGGGPLEPDSGPGPPGTATGPGRHGRDARRRARPT